MIVYLETSVLLRKLFNQATAIQDWTKWDRVLSSRLTQVEAFRNLDRLRLMGKISEASVATLSHEFREIFKRVEFIEIGKSVLVRAAGAFPTHVRTLDAIHLASALQWKLATQKEITFLTHDVQLSRAAIASGLVVEGS